ncbi:MAG TPA: NADP-dependent isocitrate dehydrogenase [Terriglobia bacterium]|nr:NADP-dependent isocitrate dehydrogenase [Terriglobia bacterium]
MNFHVTSAGKKLVTLIPGDGIGPECVQSAERIIEAAGAAVEWERREAGAEVFKRGLPSGVPQETIESVRKTRVVLKGPLATPVGFGEKSANVTLRKLFETYGNIRPVREMPGVPTPYSGRGVDLVVVRENVEDLYAGIEYMQTPGVAEGLKLISRKGCEKIARLAFEFARSEGRRRVHCATKSNIMKLTEGLLKRTFEEVSKEYPEIEASHIIIDNCAHQLVKKPEQFDVIVTTNMNGDIISDLSSALVGGLGFAPSANIGNDVAIFEAVHGSAPKYAGKNVINPTAVVLSSVMMLRHLGEFEAASKIEHAVLVTLEEGESRTGDVAGYDKGVSTSAYTDAIISSLGRKSAKWKVRDYKPIKLPQVPSAPVLVTPATRKVIGVDVFVESPESAEKLGPQIEHFADGGPFRLKLISNRGTKVYPAMGAITDCVDHWRCRFVARSGDAEITDDDVFSLVQKVGAKHRWCHLEKLFEFDGKPGFTKDQGED